MMGKGCFQWKLSSPQISPIVRWTLQTQLDLQCPFSRHRVRRGLEDGGCAGAGGGEDIAGFRLGDGKEDLHYLGIKLGAC